MDRTKVGQDYLTPTLTVAEVCARHGIDASQLYRIVADLGIPKRNSPDFDHYVLSRQEAS